jgi:hypothetical protein
VISFSSSPKPTPLQNFTPVIYKILHRATDFYGFFEMDCAIGKPHDVWKLKGQKSYRSRLLKTVARNAAECELICRERLGGAATALSHQRSTSFCNKWDEMYQLVECEGILQFSVRCVHTSVKLYTFTTKFTD